MHEMMHLSLNSAATQGAITLAQLAAALPLRIVIELRASLTPLGKEGVPACDVPARDLGVFWEQCKRVLGGLGPTVVLAGLRREHLVQVGPLLLGDAVWAVVREEKFTNWDSFKDVVE